MKYVLYIDYRSGHNISYEYRDMEADNPFDAIAEADSVYDTNTMYLIRIMEKRDKIEKRIGYKCQRFEAVMCKRSNAVGWHKNDISHSESAHNIIRCYIHKDCVWYELEHWYDEDK